MRVLDFLPGSVWSERTAREGFSRSARGASELGGERATQRREGYSVEGGTTPPSAGSERNSTPIHRRILLTMELCPLLFTDALCVCGILLQIAVSYKKLRAPTI